MSKKSTSQYSIQQPPIKGGTYINAPKDTLRRNGDNQRPIFSFLYMDPDYSITKCQDNDKSKFITEIIILSTMTWQEIKISPRHLHGAEKIKKENLRIKIPTGLTPDITILAMRFAGLKPMLGYRECDVFHIIGFDDKFNAYNHGS